MENEEIEMVELHCGIMLTQDDLEARLNDGSVVFAIDVQEYAETGDCIQFIDTEEYAIDARSAYRSAVQILDTDDWYSDTWSWTDDIVYVEGEGFYTHDYACDNYHQHDDGDWYDYPEERDYDCDEELDDYGFNPASKWGFETLKGGKTTNAVKKQLYYGLELEYEIDDSDDAYELRQTAHDLEFGASADGSLDCGVEFKSKPLCIDLVKERVPALLSRVRGSVHAERTCGLHIHLSKSGLTLMQIGLIQDFLYNDHNNEFINKLAGRKPNTYCQRNGDYGKLGRIRPIENYKFDASGNRIIDPRTHNFIVEKKKDFWGGEKYEALNFCRKDTIEFRLFAGSMRPHRVLGRVEFVQALVEWTGDTERRTFAEVRDFQQFLNFIKNSGRKRFPNLLELCYEKELLIKKQKPVAKAVAV